MTHAVLASSLTAPPDVSKDLLFCTLPNIVFLQFPVWSVDASQLFPLKHMRGLWFGLSNRFIQSPLIMARSQYSEGPATGHLDTGFSWFPCA